MGEGSALFWQILPELCTYSAMRLLHFVTPAVLFSHAFKFYTYSTTRWNSKGYRWRRWLILRKWLKFIFTRAFFLVIGLDAFLAKMGQVQNTLRLNKHTFDPWVLMNI